jgi:hypothetical protein
MATLAKLLQVDMGLPDMAKRLAAAGRGKDSILAHINPKEAKLLKKHGGSGKINPETGIMEFDNGEGYFTEGSPEVDYSNDTTSSNVAETIPVKPPAEIPPAPSRQITDYQSKAPDDTTVPAGLQTDFSRPNLPVRPALTAPAAPVVEEAGLPSQASQSLARYPGDEMSAAAAAVPAATGEEQTKPSYAKRFANFISPVTQGAETLTEALNPLAPYAKFGTQAFGIYQANKAANETREQSARNEAEIRALADPYRKQAELMQQQGQKMLAAGQSGQLTPQQQQDLETRRAVALQQQAAAGVSGGTAQQQVEADIQRTAQQYAQQNISQGLALMSQAQNVAGTADTLVKQAIAQGYAGSQDANKLASEFYNAIGFSLPQTSSKGP